MNLISGLLTILAIGLGLLLLAPVLSIGIGLVAVFACAAIWLLPIVLIMASDRTGGGEKLAWILAIIFLSWFAWIFYLLLAPIGGRHRRHERSDSYYSHNGYDADRRYRRRWDRYSDSYDEPNSY